MKTVAHVSTDDLINSLLQSVSTNSTAPSVPKPAAPTTSPPSKPLESTTPPPSQPSELTGLTPPNSAAPQSESPLSTDDSALPPANKTPSLTPKSTSPVTEANSTPETTTGATKDSGDGGALLSVGITIGVLVLVVAALFFVRSQRSRSSRKRNSVTTPPAVTTTSTVPAHRGFKKERELGVPEMSIELSPGELGLSKGFDVSYASSTGTSIASNQFDASNASSTDSSVFNTRGGLSPSFSSRKMNSYSYHYRESEETGNANPNLASSTMFHLSGLIGNGQANSRGGSSNPSRGLGSRKLSAPDEYAELVTATNAHDKMDMDTQSHLTQGKADFTQSATSQHEMDISMGPDDNHSFLAPLPTRAMPAPTRAIPTSTRALPASNRSMVVRASEESMGPDSPVTGRNKRIGPVYNTISTLSGEKMPAVLRSSEEDSHTTLAASFLTESSISSTSTRDSDATTGSTAYVSSMPLLQQLSSADHSDYGEDTSFDRASTESSDSANMARPGSLIALNLEAKEGSSEIAI